MQDSKKMIEETQDRQQLNFRYAMKSNRWCARQFVNAKQGLAGGGRIKSEIIIQRTTTG